MKQRRTRLIVAQSVITAVLLGVIAMTILSPEDQNELFGVNVPEQRIEPPGSNDQDGDRGDAGGRDGDEADEDRDEADAADDASRGLGLVPGGAVAGTGGTGLTAPGTPPATPTGEPGDDDAGGDEDDGGPPGEQYDDTLSRLNAAID